MSLPARVPRYTSYPIYPKWNNKLSLSDIEIQVKDIDELDVYVHIPFCVKPCFYCGCNKIVAKQGDIENKYVDYLIKEWKQYIQYNPNMKIKSLHFGGGTPTFLSPTLIEKLLEEVVGKGNICDLSIEIDPRITTLDQVKSFQKFGLQRVSMGIQDVSPEVQQVINRKQPKRMVTSLVEGLRDLNIQEINFDFIYGLPKQNFQTIDETIEFVKEIQPMSISLFSYAHIPSQFPLQKRFAEFLPSGDIKDAFYHYYKKHLDRLGYTQIGLDHFALKESELLKSYQQENMRRSFMGYTKSKSLNTIGLGISAISELSGCFYQNVKNIDDYYSIINEGKNAFFYSHSKSIIDKTVSKVIESIMCYKKADIRVLISSLSQAKAHEFIQGIKDKFINDGLVSVEDGIIDVKDDEELLLRRVCQYFDLFFESL